MIFPHPNLPNLNYPRDTTQNVVSGTDTFRRASRMLLQSKLKTQYNNFGGNRANINKNMRRIWNADDGYLLCQPDQSGAEALIVSYLCRPGKYRQLFQNGIKPHTYLALKLFKEQWKSYVDPLKVDVACQTEIPQLNSLNCWKEIADIIKDSDNWEAKKRYYHFAKKTIHAKSYRMKFPRFRLEMLKESEGEINLTNQEAKAFLAGFDIEFPEIEDWHYRTFGQIKQTKQLRNLFGHPYNITDYIPDDIEKCKDFIAWVPQSTVAEITRQALVKLYEYIKIHKRHWMILLDTHDSYAAQAPYTQTIPPQGEILELARIMKSYLEIDLVSPFDGTPFKMKSGVSIGKNWGPFDPKKNPEGLNEIKL